MTTPTFFDLPLSDEVRKALVEMDFKTPTDVQLAAYGPAIEGRDIVVQARTGTGKTVAFGLPMVDRLVDAAKAAPQALVLTPTRELALQCKREIEKLGVHKRIRVAAIYGGAGIVGQEDELKKGVHIVCGTPGRVLDMMGRGSLNFEALKVFVLDEADEMLSMGFAKELLEISQQLPKKRQTFLFSATLDEPLLRTSAQYLGPDPVRISLSSDEVGARTIQHYMYLVRGSKAADLCKVLDAEDPESAIVFCNTKVQTEELANHLRREGFVAEALNGDLPQSERERVLQRTRDGRLRYLVATDVAARGIDISHLTHVVNFDFPDGAESYVHRTGRTGRAGRTGTALSLIAPQDLSALYMLKLNYRISPIERPLPDSTSLDAALEASLLARWSEGLAGVDVGRRGIATRLAQRLLTHEDREAILAGVVAMALPDDMVPTALHREAKQLRRARTPQSTLEAAAEATLESERAASGGEPKPAGAGVQAEASPSRKRRSDRPERGERSEPAERGSRQEYRERSDRADRGDREDRGERTESQHAARVEASNGADHGAWSGQVVTDASGDMVDIFVNVGRRDDLRSSDVATLVTAQGNVPADHIGRVRVRDRHSFVQVKKQTAEQLVLALSGKPFGERILVAEISRRDQSNM